MADSETVMATDLLARSWAAPLFARGPVVDVTRVAGGNVNDTYCVIFEQGSGVVPFILQRLNAYVFRNPQAVMANLRMLDEHVTAELLRTPPVDEPWYMPSIIATRDGADYEVREGGCWRALTMVPDSDALPCVQDREHALQTGVALGRYQQLLSNLPPERLADTLEGFHVTPRYLAQLDAVLATPDGAARAEADDDARAMLRFINRRRARADILERAVARGELLLRPVHGDPKVANVMIDRASRRAVAMIDLDTSKPGLVQTDFGDCVRSTCNPAGEEPDDRAQVGLDLDLLAAVARGYFRFANAFLTPADHAYLFDSIWLLAFELAVRFYCDYVAGNRYFKVRHERHNLERATVQRLLDESIERQEGEIRRVLAVCRAGA